MTCHVHLHKPSSVTCHCCGKKLCDDCVERFSASLCEQCFLLQSTSYARRLRTTFFISLFSSTGVFVIAQLLMQDSTVWLSLWLAYMAGGVPIGWRLIDMWRSLAPSDEYDGIHPFARSRLIKLLASVLIGVIMTPMATYIGIKNLIVLQRLSKEHQNAATASAIESGKQRWIRRLVEVRRIL
ncbi:hypothetical protein [Paenibacillus cremeus]|uniref:B box-type domain-containing protein n=1 Tax=Paenibacillus cremeus TaxID=2163881 RepID=A0A559K992_9BACL|nr:hypothetical protein [Paenibacillus cremeus]TVY08687.1 hypothetical protein FPZ49_17870 [Paenibacillus cremeus]